MTANKPLNFSTRFEPELLSLELSESYIGVARYGNPCLLNLYREILTNLFDRPVRGARAGGGPRVAELLDAVTHAPQVGDRRFDRQIVASDRALRRALMRCHVDRDDH
jgi:hypothetical protein